MGVPAQLMPTWTPTRLQAWPRSTSPHRGQLCPGRLPSMLPGRPSSWAVLAMPPSPQPAPRRGKGSSMASRKNREPPRPLVPRGRCCASRSRTPSAGPASASSNGNILLVLFATCSCTSAPAQKWGESLRGLGRLHLKYIDSFHVFTEIDYAEGVAGKGIRTESPTIPRCEKALES